MSGLTGGVFAATCRHGVVYCTKAMTQHETLSLQYEFVAGRVMGSKLNKTTRAESTINFHWQHIRRAATDGVYACSLTGELACIYSCLANTQAAKDVEQWACSQLGWISSPLIVYDNACNAFLYTLKRCPIIALSTSFKVDKFHQRGHKCSKELHLTGMNAINSSAVEQVWSVLRGKVAASLASMALAHAVLAVKLFIATYNVKKNKKNC